MQKVFIVAGAGASGKSSYAKILKKREGLVLLDLDDRLAELLAKDPAHVHQIGMEAFLREIRQYRYEDLRQRGLALLGAGSSIVLVAPFTQQIRDEKVWGEYMQPFIDLGISPELHWVHVSAKEQVRRMRERGAVRDGEKLANAANLAQYQSANEPAPPVVAHLAIDGSARLRK